MRLATTNRTTIGIATTAVVLGAFWVGTNNGGAADAAPLANMSLLSQGSSKAGSTPGVSVLGTAEVAGKPDTLRLSLSVNTRATTIKAALDQANATTTKLQSTLTAAKVDAKDMQTSNLQIQPEYSSPASGRPTLVGYTVSQSLNVTLRDLGTAGTTITTAVAAGGNLVHVDGINLDLENNTAMLSTARDKAIANARSKAEQYAKASGRKLGAVVSISETTSDSPPVEMAAQGRESAVPIIPGTQNVGVSVTVVYAFD